MKLGLTFDDILIVPKYSDIESRKLINLTTNFSRRIKLNIPVISANMDTVTESQMAIVMAREGGIGVIHRFLSIDDQAEEIQKVKRAENILISDPLTISKDSVLSQAIELMKKNNVTGILVTDDKNYLEGIVTSRDIRFENNLSVPIAKIMTPGEKLITAPSRINISEAIKMLDKYKLEKLPLIDKKGKVTGLITASDFMKLNQNKNAAKDVKGRLLVAAAIGVKDAEERGEKLVKAGADVLVIDIAHGHHQKCLKVTRMLKSKFPKTDIIAGNVATAKGVKDLIKAGADAVKIGIGPGAACSTRVVAGAGVPQITAILEAATISKRYNIPLIADGGIRYPGDVAKAIGAGASSIMIGSLFAGTKESPGEYFLEDGAAFKIYRGLASRDVSGTERTPEGVSGKVSYKGEVKKVIQQLLDGLQSGMSYSGSKNIKEFWKKVEFIQITQAGLKESLPHDIL